MCIRDRALLVGDVLATGFWAARISEITPEDTVLILSLIHISILRCSRWILRTAA